MNYFINELSKFKNSFSLDKKFIKVFLAELIFILLILGTFFVWYSVSTSKFESINGALSATDISNVGQLNSFVDVVNQYLFMFLFLTLSMVILLFLAFGFTRSYFLSKIWKERYSFKFALKFTLLKFLWQIIWLPLIIILLIPIFSLSVALESNPYIIQYYVMAIYVNLIVYLIMGYFGMFLYKSYFEHKKIYRAITESFKHGIKKFPKLIFPLFLVIISFLFLWIFLLILNAFGISFMVTNFIFFLIVLTASRIFVLTKLSH